MILQALTEYYDALEQKGEISRAGWCRAKTAFAICLNEKGELTNILPLKEEVDRGNRKVEISRDMTVPAQVTRTAGVKANFLCDNGSYLLGIDAKGNPERTKICLNASAKLHKDLLLNVDCVEAQAICSYFQNWDTENASEHPAVETLLEELKAGGNLVFRVGNKFAHEVDLICEAWDALQEEASDEPVMQCLITGKRAPVARLHRPVKGVRDAQSSGAALVSFNAPAFESFEKSQSYNSPVCEEAAFSYTTALNSLLADRNRRIFMGDSTIVFWAETAETAYQDFFQTALDPSADFDEMDLIQAMQRLARGDFFDFDGVSLSPETKFYILGLSPNAARIAVRFFYRNRFGDVARNILEHYERLEVVRPSFDNRKYLSVGSLLQETVNKNSRDKNATPLLAGSVLRSVFNNTRYPAALLNGVILRIRAEQDINRGRAAIIKACLIKNYEKVEALKEVLTVELNEQTTFQPYVLGRLFAVLESLQERANPGINTTIKNKYFNSACATPEMIFPVLFKLSQSHLRKLDTGLGIYFDKMITELTGKITETYPAHHSLQEQGAFQLGYYHQKQKFFEKKKEEE